MDGEVVLTPVKTMPKLNVQKGSGFWPGGKSSFSRRGEVRMLVPEGDRDTGTQAESSSVGFKYSAVCFMQMVAGGSRGSGWNRSSVTVK